MTQDSKKDDMNIYIGCKVIKAKPMTKGEFEEMEDIGIKSNHPPEYSGYLVKYEDGYTAWSPKDVFDAAYRPINMSFIRE